MWLHVRLEGLHNHESSPRNTLLLHLGERAFALVVALAVITTLMVAAQRCLHLLFEPWIFWTRAILVAHVVMETLPYGTP